MNESQLRADSASVSPDLRARLDAAGFDADRLVSLAAPLWERVTKGGGDGDWDARNRVPGRVEAPREGDVRDAPAPGTAEHEKLAATGLEAMKRGSWPSA